MIPCCHLSTVHKATLMVSVYAASLLAQKRFLLILSCMIAEPSILLKDTIVLEDNRRKKA